MTKDEYYLSIALVVAKKSKCLLKQYGAVIVNDDEIVSTGYNGNVRGEPDCISCTKVKCNKDEAEYLTCKSVHAEMNAIISASRKEMLGSTMYLAGYITSTGEYISLENDQTLISSVYASGGSKTEKKYDKTLSVLFSLTITFKRKISNGDDNGYIKLTNVKGNFKI